MISLRSRGRGGAYSVARGLVESALGLLYVGDWPATLWAKVPGACVVRRRALPLPLPPGAPALRLAFVSDLHLGPTTPARLLDRAFEVIAEAEPDVLLLGGDYVFLEATEAKALELRDRLRALPCARKIAVLGNHDLWARHERLERAFAQAGVEVLVNTSTSLVPGALTLVALDDPWTGRREVERAFEGVPHDETIVVLCHAADFLLEVRAAVARLPASRARRVLYVCGHTHGGQIALPWGPIVVPGPIGRHHPAGLYTFEELLLYVSRGIGATELPIRTFAPPEVLVIDAA